MKQIVDQLNKIAKKIDENVDIPNTDLITDSLDAITTALGGTPNDSNLIVDKLEDIAGVAHGGGGGGSPIRVCKANITNESTTDDLYVDYYGGGITLGSHLMGPAGSTGTLMPYVPSANAMNDSGDYKNRGFIAEKNGGTGIIYFINSGWNARMGDDWVWDTGLFTVSKSDTNISIEIVSNVSKLDADEYSYDYVLTDNTVDGEINITISGS